MSLPEIGGEKISVTLSPLSLLSKNKLVQVVYERKWTLSPHCLAGATKLWIPVSYISHNWYGFMKTALPVYIMFSKFMCVSPGRLALGVSVEGDRYVGFYLQSGHLVTDNQITTVKVTTWDVIFFIFTARLNWCENNLVWKQGPILSQRHF